ncbi:efflux RND transporter periplasmic adaptor subunit [Pyruvatibacter sp.]|uniref:efflux RND transporter periplasmic adaptor subunit n=1 Tax=Pyruvatibacter sp. TaxID=1981328 RepID=UPI0032EF14EE
MQVMKWILGIGVVVLLVCGGGLVFLFPKIQDAIEAQRLAGMSPLVEVQEAEKGELIRTISAPGSVRPRREVNISARVSAKIDELPFEAGDLVQAGDLVVRLDARDLQAILDGANARKLADEASLLAAEASLIAEQASLKGQRSGLINAEQDWERNKQLFESGDISESILDDSRTAWEQAQAAYDARKESLEGLRANVAAAGARVKVAEAEVEQANENLKYATISSPITGYITALNAEVGELVVTGTMNNAGTVILTIADLSEMLVEARLSEVDVTRVKPGQSVKVQVNGYDDEFDGTLRRVGLQSRPSNDGTTFFDAEVVLHLADTQRMFAGLTANIDIEIERLNEIRVPSQAVMDKRVEELPQEIRENESLIDPDETFVQVVYVYDGGKAQVRPVEVGGATVTDTAIVGGLELGEQVITGPFSVLQTLSHGDSVRTEDADEGADDAATIAADDETPDEPAESESDVAADSGEEAAT